MSYSVTGLGTRPKSIPEVGVDTSAMVNNSSVENGRILRHWRWDLPNKMCYYTIAIAVAYALLVNQRLRTTASSNPYSTTPAHEFSEQRENVEMESNQQHCKCRTEPGAEHASCPAESCCSVKSSDCNDSISSSCHLNSSSTAVFQCIHSLLLQLYKEQQWEIDRLKQHVTDEWRREKGTSAGLEGMTVQQLQVKVDALHRELEEKVKEIDKLVEQLHASYWCFSSVMNNVTWTVWNGVALLLMSYWQIVLLCTCCCCCCCSYCIEQFGWVAKR